MGKTSISVPEMQRLLGMKKVEAYWLVKQGRFKVILVGGKMRIMLDSFEEWYGSQFRYKKVNGPEPGQLLPASLTCLLYTSPSPRDMRRSRMPSSA